MVMTEPYNVAHEVQPTDLEQTTNDNAVSSMRVVRLRP